MFTEIRVLHESNDDDHLVCSPCCRLMRFCSCSAVALGYILWISDIPIYIYISMSGIWIGNELPHCWWYECTNGCQAEKKVGFWDVGKVAPAGNAYWRKGRSLEQFLWSVSCYQSSHNIYMEYLVDRSSQWVALGTFFHHLFLLLSRIFR